MSRHRAFRNRNYSYDDDYYDEDYDDGYEAGRLYTADDAYEMDTAAEQAATEAEVVDDLAEVVVAELQSRLAASAAADSTTATYSHTQMVEAAQSSAYDVDMALAILISSADAVPAGTPAAQQQAAAPAIMSAAAIGSRGGLVPVVIPAAAEKVKSPKAAPATQAHAGPAGYGTPVATPKGSAKKGTVGKAKKGADGAAVAAAAGGTGADSRPSSTVSSPAPAGRSGLRFEEQVRTSPGRDSAAMDAAIAEDDEGREEVEEAEPAGAKQRLSMVVVGHVDAGKSTLMGQVLVKMGHVSQRVLHKHEREAREQGKASFYLAWIMDEDEEERAHGVTIDVAQKHIVTETKLITLLDAPGHRDFIPKMISGACAADVAVLVVPATPGEFESCFESSGQTKEHALLVKALGVNQVVVAVNKLDAAVPPWDEGRYESIKASVEPFLRQIGFKAGKVRFVPVSGLSGENVATLSSDCPLSTWYRGDTFLQAIDRFTAAPRAVLKPMRMVCSDIAPTGKGVVVSGRLLQGRLQQGNRVLVMPIGDLATASRVEKGGAQPGPARAGDSVEVTLTGVDVTRMVPGSCLCKARTPVPVAEKLEAQVATLDALAVPLIRGTEFLLHLQGVDITAHVSKLIALTNSAGTVIKARPRCVPSGATAHVQLTLSRPICVERYADCRALGRFVLRQKGQTVAVGLVLELKA